MKQNALLLFALAMSLAACAAPATITPAPISMPIEVNTSGPHAPATEVPAEPQGKLRAPSFESQTYINEAVGFALEYPAQWTVQETVLGERASQSVLLSSPAIADLATVPNGETRVAVIIYQWDPKNDLAAFVETRKAAWEASGFTILDEEPLTLDLGLDAVRFTIQTSDGLTVPFLFSAIGDHYLSISGEGDLALVEEIMHYLRPVSK